MSDLVGAMLSDYLLQQHISKGGVADIYRGRQMPGEAQSFDVAVKIFRSGYAQRAAFREYFMTEAEKIGQFDHPNILPFLEYGEGENLLYLVTPFVESGTLEALLRKVGGRFSATQALPIVQQLCSAVQYAHERGVAHGNIKPSNVFVAPDGRMLLSDFGIAHGFDDSQQSLTRVGWGTAEYAAPEQSLGVLRPTSDIYSLGVLIFRILTGVPPFTGNTPVEVLLKHVRQSPPSAHSLVPHISDAVDAVLMRAMQKRSDERFASVEDLARAYTQAIIVASVASSVARSFTTIKLASPTLSMIEPQESQEPLTPDPTPYTGDSAHVQTPVSALLNEDVTWTPNLVETPLPETEGASASDESDMPVVVATTRDAPYDKATSYVWSADPVEWSPIAKDEQSLPGVPMTAGGYLDGKASVSETGEPVQLPEGEGKRSFQTRLWKWLPFIIVILLLIGLLAAILSAFFYPGSSSETFIQQTLPYL